MNAELINSLVLKFEESATSIDKIVKRFEQLFDVIGRLEKTSGQLKDNSRVSELEKIAQKVSLLNAECEGTLGRLVEKSQEFDSNVGRLDKYASEHEKELKKSITSFTHLINVISEFNANVRPGVDEMVNQIRELSGVTEAIHSVSNEMSTLKNTVVNDTESIRKDLVSLNESVKSYYKKNMSGFTFYLNEIKQHAAASANEMSTMNDQLTPMRKTCGLNQYKAL